MSITGLLKRNCTQTAVYWGTPVPDGYGGYTFADAVEISVRWEDKKEILSTKTENDTENLVSKSVVYTLQDVEELGWLYLGELTDIDSAYLADPRKVIGAYKILQFHKIPTLKVDTYIRKAYL